MDKGDLIQQQELMDKISRWAKMAPGGFTVRDLDYDFGIDNPQDKVNRIAALEQMVVDGDLERSGNRRGHYRPVITDLKQQDIAAVKDTPVDIWLPFNAGQLVDIFPKNTITLGGEKNAGKTALLLNIAIHNRKNWNVHYFNSEMGDQELKRRLQRFRSWPFNAWQRVNFYERARDFSDVIFSGTRDLNIIDFLELSDEFWKVGQMVRDIHDKLGQAIAIIAVQKKRGAADPRGGEFVKEKSRLHFDLSNQKHEYGHRLTINPAKNWKTDVNPTGLYCSFKLVQGGDTMPLYTDNEGKHWFRDQ